MLIQLSSLDGIGPAGQAAELPLSRDAYRRIFRGGLIDRTFTKAEAILRLRRTARVKRRRAVAA